MHLLRKLTESRGNVLGYRVEDEVTTQDVASLQADLQAAIADHGDVRVLIDAEGLDDVDPGAVWQDLKMLGEYVSSLERMAVVGDERWHDVATAASKLVTEARSFEPQERDQAWAWLREAA